jgi:DNA excision repair protein ERCC-4
MNAERIVVIADDREANSDVVRVLRDLAQVQLEIKRLTRGDYLVAQRLLFERKTLPDLVASIRDGRLFSQARGLCSAKTMPALILQGSVQDLRDSGMTRAAIQGALVSLTFRFGIPILRARDGRECALLMLYAAQQTSAGRIALIRRPGPTAKAKQRRQLYILQGFPGIGALRSRHLLAHYGSLVEIFNASAKDLQNLPGMGRKTAESMYRLLH